MRSYDERYTMLQILHLVYQQQRPTLQMTRNPFIDRIAIHQIQVS